MALVYRKCNSIVAHIPAVHAEVVKAANTVASKADARLAAHRKTGKHRITVSFGKVDAFVNLEGVHALSLEYGHFTPGGKTWVEGIHVLTGALGI